MAKADKESLAPLARVTRRDIAEGLRTLGLTAGDVVMVHSSLSQFGKVEGGPDAAIDAVLEVIGPSGTVVFPTFTGVDIDKMTVPPETLPAFTGAVPEAARRRKDFIKSSHPMYSICAKGPLAKEICDLNDTYIFPSVEKKFIYRMGEHGGKALLLGCDHSGNSAIHLVSEFAGVEFKVQDKEWWGLTVAEFLKMPREEQARLLDTHMGFRLPYRPVVHLNAIDEPLRRAGAIKTVKVGNAYCHLMKIMDVVRVGAQEAKKNPWFLCDKLGRV